MPETRLVLTNFWLDYEGIFSAKDLMTQIDAWFEERGYQMKEVKSEERITPTGKYVEWDVKPWKKITDYVMFEIRILAKLYDVETVEVERGKHKKEELNKGRIKFFFEAFLTTDYEGRWENRPVFFIIRTMYDKFVYAAAIRRMEAQIIRETHELNDRLKSFLNLYKYKG